MAGVVLAEKGENQMNNIQATEQAIENGTARGIGPNVYPVRVYNRTTSPVHVAAGAHFSLALSYRTMESFQQDYIEGGCDLECDTSLYDFVVVKDGRIVIDNGEPCNKSLAEVAA